LAEEYEAVVQVLNAALGASLSKASVSDYQEGDANRSSAFGMQEDLLSSAQSIIDHYEQRGIIRRRISDKAMATCQRLLQLKRAFALYEQNRLEDALALVEQTRIIPFDADMVAMVRQIEDFKSLDDSILRNIDAILLTTMNLLYKIHTSIKESPYGDPSRQAKIVEVRRKAKALMMYAGMLKYRLSGDTYSHLTRLDVYLH